jgi:hypothetical protein
MAAEDYDKLSDSEKKKEDWMNSKWRPMMGWTYMITCIFDFVLAPVMWSILQSISHGSVQTQWQPLTLQGAGLYHIAMGAVLGIAAYGRTQEKMAGANNGGISVPGSVGTTYTPPPATPTSFGVSTPAVPSGTGFGSAPAFSAPVAAPSFSGSNGTGSVSPAPSFGAVDTSAPPAFGSVITSSSGKPGPVQPDHPEI